MIERFGLFDGVLSDTATLVLAGVCVGAWLLAAGVIALAAAAGWVGAALRRELVRRTASWLALIVVLAIPVLAGPGWAVLGVGLLGVACYREFARATGLFRERVVSLCVALGIGATIWAALDQYYPLFVAVVPLGAALIAVASLPSDRPQGYIQRTALGLFAFLLFGPALGHLGYLANAADYRPVVLLLLIAVGLNDVFAFVVGKALGSRKLLPATSPGKTVAGALGALVLTTAAVVAMGRLAFAGTPMHGWLPLAALGVTVSVLGQAGDLMLSAIKRDLGLKDTGALIPGHGGLLDRFDSLLLVAPAAFYIIVLMGGVTFDPARRWLVGG